MERALRILFVTPECAPHAKVGGLADVSAALPHALRAAGVDVRILVPGYAGMLYCAGDSPPVTDIPSLPPFPAARLLGGRIASGVPLLILDHAPHYRRNGGPYQDDAGVDWPDNALRFGLLSRVAALLGSAATPLSWRPHVLHLHDWPAALAAAYLHYTPGVRAASVMTVHNLAFQGNFAAGMLETLGLPAASFTPQGLEFHGLLSFLKAGLAYADALSTVSQTYATEIQSEQHGAGMHGILRERHEVLHGILNGIDESHWDPATDACLPFRYDAQALENKAHMKHALRARLNLPRSAERRPLLGVVSRLTHQKGIDLLIAAAPHLTGMAELVVLGAGQSEHEQALNALAARYPDRIAVTIGFDEELAHWIEAGADVFLMPSRFEPCGLNQMYSQRYGTPPVAHATGGLADTIVDCTPPSLEDGTATGFLFGEPTVAAFAGAVSRAVAAYRMPDTWRALQRNGMRRDFSWGAPARRYADLYRALARARAPD